jgi:DNA-binding MarR family transcriptional regulator
MTEKLNIQQIKILKYIRKYSPVSNPLIFEDLQNKTQYTESEISHLRKSGYISCSQDFGDYNELLSSAEIYITPKGKHYLEQLRKENFRFWFPISIASVSLLISIIALLT